MALVHAVGCIVSCKLPKACVAEERGLNRHSGKLWCLSSFSLLCARVRCASQRDMHEIRSVDEETSSIMRADVIYLPTLLRIVCLVFSQGYNRAMLTMPDGAMISIEEARVLCTYGMTAWDGTRNWFPESEVRIAFLILPPVEKFAPVTRAAGPC